MKKTRWEEYGLLILPNLMAHKMEQMVLQSGNSVLELFQAVQRDLTESGSLQGLRRASMAFSGYSIEAQQFPRRVKADDPIIQAIFHQAMGGNLGPASVSGAIGQI